MKLCLVVLKLLSGNENLAKIKGNNSGTNFGKIMCNNPKLDHVNINAHTSFGEILYESSEYIERK